MKTSFLLLSFLWGLSLGAEEQNDSSAAKIEKKTSKEKSKGPAVKVGGKVFQVEVARTRGEWQKGLMYHDILQPQEGMLFVGTEEKVQFFWMKNTLFSLDIIFISKNKKIVSIAENAPPMSEDRISSIFPAQHVLEVLAGTAKKYKLKAGDRVTFLNVK